MLVTLLVLWVVVIPALTLAGTYALSGVLGRYMRGRIKDTRALAAEPVSIGATRRRRTRVRSRDHGGRSRDHAFTKR